jgi:hypothetical protein
VCLPPPRMAEQVGDECIRGSDLLKLLFYRMTERVEHDAAVGDSAILAKIRSECGNERRRSRLRRRACPAMKHPLMTVALDVRQVPTKAWDQRAECRGTTLRLAAFLRRCSGCSFVILIEIFFLWIRRSSTRSCAISSALAPVARSSLPQWNL